MYKLEQFSSAGRKTAASRHKRGQLSLPLNPEYHSDAMLEEFLGGGEGELNSAPIMTRAAILSESYAPDRCNHFGHMRVLCNLLKLSFD